MNQLMILLRRVTNSSAHPFVASTGRRSFLKVLLLVALSFCSYLFFSRLVVTAVEVKGASMSPTLSAGDRLLLNRFAYLHREPQRGELVVLKDPETGDLIVKRIVGLPCETVLMQNESTYVNGHRLFEPYAATIFHPAYSSPGKATTIPRNHYFVMGDNRTRSLDSRVFGSVPRDSILGVISM